MWRERINGERRVKAVVGECGQNDRNSDETMADIELV